MGITSVGLPVVQLVTGNSGASRLIDLSDVSGVLVGGVLTEVNNEDGARSFEFLPLPDYSQDINGLQNAVFNEAAARANADAQAVARLDALYVDAPPTLPAHTLYHATLQDGQLVWDGTLTTITTGEAQEQIALAALCLPLPVAGHPNITLSVEGCDPASGLIVAAAVASQGTDPVPVLAGDKIADLYVPNIVNASLNLSLSSDAVSQTFSTPSSTMPLPAMAVPAGSVVWIMLYANGPTEYMATPVTVDFVSQTTGIVAELQTSVQALTDRVNRDAEVFSAGVAQFGGYVGEHSIPAVELVDGAVWRLSGAGRISELIEARAVSPQLRLSRTEGGINEQADGVADAASTLDRVVSWQGFLCVQAGKIKFSVQVAINDQVQLLYTECTLFTDSGASISVIAAGGFGASQTTQIASVLEKLK